MDSCSLILFRTVLCSRISDRLVFTGTDLFGLGFGHSWFFCTLDACIGLLDFLFWFFFVYWIGFHSGFWIIGFSG
jgi:hypothetical protein